MRRTYCSLRMQGRIRKSFPRILDQTSLGASGLITLTFLGKGYSALNWCCDVKDGDFTWRWDISDPRDNFVLGSHENWVGYYPGAISTRQNNTWENCILNVQRCMVFNKNFVLSVFSILSGYFRCSISIKWISSCILCVFTFGPYNFRHVGFHVRILVMRITVEVVPAPRDIPVQSVHMDNSCPG